MQIFSITVDDETARVIAEAFAVQFNYQPGPPPVVVTTTTTTVDATPAHATPADATPADATPSDATPGWVNEDATPVDLEFISKMEFARQKVIDFVANTISRYQMDQAIQAAQAKTQELLANMTID